MKLKFILFIFFSLFYLISVEGQKINIGDSLKIVFRNPPSTSNLSAYWQWMGGNITKEGITKDLEAMSEKGVKEVIIFNISSFQDADFGVPKIKFATREWLEMFQFTLREANRLGMVVGAENCDGWSQSGGSWVPVDQSMKQYVWNKTQIRGGGLINIRLDQPVGKIKDFYRDVCVVAYKSPVQSEFYKKNLITSTDSDSISCLTDGNPVSSYLLKIGQYIDIKFKEPYFAEKLLLHLQKIFEWKNDKYSASFELQKSINGINYTHLADLKNNYLNEPVVFDIPPSEATHFRLVSKDKNIDIAELALFKKGERGLFNPQISFHQIKTVTTQAQQMNSYFAENYLTDQKYVIKSTTDVVDISEKMTADGQLNWQAPEGDWTVIRMGYSGTGKTNVMGTKEGTGYECDKLDTAAVNIFFDGYAKKLIDASGSYRGNTFDFLMVDSWECGYQNWTSGFEKEFLKRRGYSIIPFVPVLCGELIGDTEYCEAFLHDFRKTISDLISENYYKHMADLCHRNGIKFHSEAIYGDIPLPGGSPYPPLDILKANSFIDEPATEFWARINPLDTALSYNKNHQIYSTFPAHAAKMYGKRIVGSEAYTSYESYSTSPWNLKLWGDKAYTEGVNKFILHSYVHQPVEKKPGITLSQFGNAFNRHNTWWKSSASWFDFQQRVQYLLQKGKTVSDILVYAGDRLPIKGNAPTTIFGFKADYCNAELLSQAKVDNGNIVLSNGLNYRILLFNDNALELSTLKKIDELIRSGSRIICPEPVKMLSLNDLRKENIEEADKIIKRLWSKPASSENALIIDLKDLTTDRLKNELLPDMEIRGAESKDFMFIHNRDGNFDSYYLVNTDSIRTKQTEISFRIIGKQPEIWDPIDGTIQEPLLYATSNNCTTLPLTFHPKQSFFVVFRNPSTAHFEKLMDQIGNQLFPSSSQKNESIPVIQMKGNKVTSTSNKKGSYILADDKCKNLNIRTYDEKALQLDNAQVTLLEEPNVKPFSMDHLKSLTTFEDSLIKYYSGTAEYKFNFSVPKHFIGKNNLIWLNIGRFGSTAQVEMNGKFISVEWVPNRKIDISSILKSGGNNLVIRVTNPWRNRLIGDVKEKQKEKRWTTLPLYNNKDSEKLELLQSGLTGPVRIIKEAVTVYGTNAIGQENKSVTDTIAAHLQAVSLKQTVQKEGYSNSHPGAQWFPDAGLGLFIHWGVASVNATGDLSWCMLANKPWKDATITPNNYYAQIERWNPNRVDYDKMLRAAKAAGVTYAVMVTKHHDGFTFWPSEFGDMGTRKSFGGRDFVKEFVTACRKNNLRVGLYYSPPDWWFDRQYRSFSYRGEALDMDHKPIVLPAKPAGHDQKRKELIQGQVRELLINYGKIDLIWFDGGNGEISNDEVRKLQPGILVNRRNGGNGDYGDSEGKLPEKRFKGWFETCETCWPSGKWSYTEDWGWDKAPQVITELVKLRAWGGNLLANLGPKSDGSIPQQALTAWKEMAEWMKHSRESVIGTQAGSWPEDVNTPVTIRNGAAYIHFLPGSTDEVVWKNATKPTKAFLLRNKKKVQFTYVNGTLKLNLPASLRTNNVDVVKLEL